MVPKPPWVANRHPQRTPSQLACLWVRACTVLHNMVIDDVYDEEWTAMQDADETDGAGQEEPAQVGAN
ncbi:hypothetical protein PsorP6_005839 [Peronosclerospora sorghi]|uniref:Uncharacterized protein n=1 Tax=Peronosclerospora sorghi TaxID=230839 RepID=A0ACC0W401_9STRA|nr:hypothetical protein PsorP6_005839 [Peronosclerospora sorghi]